jgi:DNA-binding CsgD family transcriptional regulator
VNLCSRRSAANDFDSFHSAIAPEGAQAPDIGEEAWLAFLAHSPHLSVSVEDRDRGLSSRVVGIAQLVFVRDSFVELARVGPPGPARYACKQLIDGSWPLLTGDEIRMANAAGGLNALVTCCAWRATPGDEEGTSVRAFLHRAFGLYCQGYRFKLVLVPTSGSEPVKYLLHAGYTVLTDYAGWYRENPPEPSKDRRPLLMHAAASDRLTSAGTSASQMFQYASPRFGFSPQEREQLWFTILGYSDPEVAKKMSISRETVKKHWDSVYRKVFDADMCLLPGRLPGQRGREKRARLLDHLREHMEEIRP